MEIGNVRMRFYTCIYKGKQRTNPKLMRVHVDRQLEFNRISQKADQSRRIQKTVVHCNLYYWKVILQNSVTFFF